MRYDEENMFYTDEERLCLSFIPGKLNFRAVRLNSDTPIFIAMVKREFVNSEGISMPNLVMASDTSSLAEICDELPIRKIYGVMPRRLTKQNDTVAIEIKQVLAANYPSRKPRGVVFQYLLANGESIFDGYTRAPKLIEKLKFESFISLCKSSVKEKKKP
ncbi:hypothetical protein [Methylophilus luteus]|uniref:Uncharacterized protein n=1 Tax=Methylophilus luteus TaxID=640108 RepID=A0ABW3F5Y7_9PROT